MTVSPLARHGPQFGAGAYGAEAALDFANLRRRLQAGVAISVCVVLTVFGWGAVAQLSGAVIATGIVVVEGNSKKVQHQQGGVVKEIFVKNGSRVSAGDLLVKLDDTQTRASLGIISSQLLELGGRKARLAAERDDADSVTFPSDLLAAGRDFVAIAAGEFRLFAARRTSNEGRKAQLRERIRQFEEEIKGSDVQHRAKVRELVLIGDELSRVTDMYRRNLLPVTRVLSMQRDEARIDGENGTLMAQIARLRGQIAETELQISAIDQTRSSDSQKDIRDIEGKTSELLDRKIAAEDQLRRVDLRSPIDGIVHELNAHTIGGVVQPGEQIMLIVPKADILSVEVRIQTSDIDHIKVGQTSVLRLPALNQRTTPEGKGTVLRVSPDISREAQSGQLYYTARITPDPEFMATEAGQKLVPGMPVEVFIETNQRSALSYMVKPLTDQFERAFRDH